MTHVPAADRRCAVLADGRGDHMLGTAFPAARLLLVEQPFPWGPEGLRTSHFDRATALELEARGRAAGVRVQAIRGLGRMPDHGRRTWILADTRDATRSLRFGEYTADAELLDLPLDGTAGTPDHDPLYLVCTHGRHDPCCAQHGRPLITRLTALRPGRVWQASHLGGCRFAPTLLALPDGVMYGRVAPEAAAAVVEATEAGRVARPYLRGRIGMAPAAQAALAHVQDELGLPLLRDVSLVATTVLDPATVVVEVATPGGRHEVTVRRDRVDAQGLTCAHPGASWFVAHRPAGMTPAGAP